MAGALDLFLASVVGQAALFVRTHRIEGLDRGFAVANQEEILVLNLGDQETTYGVQLLGALKGKGDLLALGQGEFGEGNQGEGDPGHRAEE